MIEVTGLYIYPVKSLQAIPLNSATLHTVGLNYDRNWMIIDKNNNAVTQREIPKMATVEISIDNTELTLSHPSAEDLKINLSYDRLKSLDVSIWKDNCIGFDEGEKASSWLNNLFARPKQERLKLVRFSQNQKRAVEPNYLNGMKSHTMFADAYPFLVASESTLEYLNSKLIENNATTVAMDRFRPNITVRGLDTFKEHETSYLSNEKYTLKLCKPCQRCKMTTIDQQTGDIRNPKEPLKTLTQLNPLKNVKGAYFGQNAVLLSGNNQEIKIGDKLQIQH